MTPENLKLRTFKPEPGKRPEEIAADAVEAFYGTDQFSKGGDGKSAKPLNDHVLPTFVITDGDPVQLAQKIRDAMPAVFGHSGINCSITTFGEKKLKDLVQTVGNIITPAVVIVSADEIEEDLNFGVE